MPTLPLSPDELLTTTRSVRKRLDLSRPVPMELIRECLQIALQAPTGSNAQKWHWIVVTDPGQRKAIGEPNQPDLQAVSSTDTSIAWVRSRCPLLHASTQLHCAPRLAWVM